jgi:hypothetical protein
VVTGSDYSVAVNHAPVQGTTATTVDPTATTVDPTATTVELAATTVELASVSTLGPPSPAVQPLPSYDPRACPSS